MFFTIVYFFFHRFAHQIGLFSKFTFALFEHVFDDVIVNLIMAARVGRNDKVKINLTRVLNKQKRRISFFGVDAMVIFFYLSFRKHRHIRFVFSPILLFTIAKISIYYKTLDRRNVFFMNAVNSFLGMRYTSCLIYALGLSSNTLYTYILHTIHFYSFRERSIVFFVVFLSTNDLFCPVKQQEREERTRVSINSKVQRKKKAKKQKRKKEKKRKVRAQVIKMTILLRE